MVKAVDQMFQSVPKFRNQVSVVSPSGITCCNLVGQVAHGQEFIEALVATLFLPSTALKLADIEQDVEESGVWE